MRSNSPASVCLPGLLIRSLLCLWIWLAPSASAHEIRPAVVNVELAPGRFEIEVTTNLEALLAGVSPQHADTNESPNAQRYDRLRELAPADLEAAIRKFVPEWLKGLAVEVDGTRAEPAVTAISIPATGDTRLARISTVRLSGAMPPGARDFRWSYAREFGDNILKVREPGREAVASVWLRNGEWSDPYVIGVGLQPRTALQVAAQYVVLGFTHILPKGLDHILFVLGLYLLSTRWKPLLIQVTAFTVAHSITLGLSIYGIFSLPATIVEPLIAASIAYVAIENVLTNRLHAWRPFVVFGFGLLHGMGFAGVLREIGLPRSEFLSALVSFNVGVELGQLTVITLAFVLTGIWFRNKPWYRSRIVVPASLLIAATGLYWTVERVIGPV
ncbi:MAG: HupE/UreJ family protein [Betaproteobacteria bacterium]